MRKAQQNAKKVQANTSQACAVTFHRKLERKISQQKKIALDGYFRFQHNFSLTL